MDDSNIIALYWQRDEAAIAETKAKYGRYCFAIAQNILSDRADAEECEADTYLEAWNKIPPAKPNALSAFLGKITRALAIDRWRRNRAQKRGGGEAELSLEELAECVPDRSSVEEAIGAAELARVISAFLRELPEEECSLFLRRYWYFDSVDALCRRYGMGASKVKMRLLRTREKLRKHLEQEEIIL